MSDAQKLMDKASKTGESVVTLCKQSDATEDTSDRDCQGKLWSTVYKFPDGSAITDPHVFGKQPHISRSARV